MNREQFAIESLKKIAGHFTAVEWDHAKKCLVDSKGKPWIHWRKLAIDALQKLGEWGNEK